LNLSMNNAEWPAKEDSMDNFMRYYPYGIFASPMEVIHFAPIPMLFDRAGYYVWNKKNGEWGATGPFRKEASAKKYLEKLTRLERK